MTSGKKGICSYRVLCAVLLLSLLASCGPGLLSLGWYLLHKHQVSFNGTTLTIPIGWTLAKEDVAKEDVTFRRRSEFLFGPEHFQMMTFYLFPSSWTPPSTAYGNWKGFVTRTYSPDAFVEVKEREIGPSPQPSLCVSASFRADPSVLRHADCILLREGIRAEFNGTSNGMGDFWGVIDKIH